MKSFSETKKAESELFRNSVEGDRWMDVFITSLTNLTNTVYTKYLSFIVLAAFLSFGD